LTSQTGFFAFETHFFHPLQFTMFLPKNEAANADIRAAEQARRDGYTRIEAWATEAIPAEIRRGVTITVQEVQCGDPECAPIDTAVAIMFPRCVERDCNAFQACN
jgi:hypothetical protein